MISFFQMMKGRNLVNAIGIPCWLFLIWKGGLYYTIFMLVSCVLALGEFYSIMEKKGAKPLRWLGMGSTVFIADYYYVQPILTTHQMLGIIIFIVLVTSFLELFSGNKNPSLNIASTFAGILFVPVLLGTSIDIRQYDLLMSTNLTFALVIAVWACDSAAFIFGTSFGTKKIMPSVSPKKSWVGSLSGLIASLLVFYFFQKQGLLGSFFEMKDALIIGLICGVVGQLGDFTESMLKRDVGIKDSGSLLAGHGGVLDRFDSLIFAFPTAYLYIHFFTRF